MERFLKIMWEAQPQFSGYARQSLGTTGVNIPLTPFKGGIVTLKFIESFCGAGGVVVEPVFVGFVEDAIGELDSLKK